MINRLLQISAVLIFLSVTAAAFAADSNRHVPNIDELLTLKTVGGAQISPDGKWLAFLSNRLEDKNQIFAINPAGGEARQLTKSETAISNFAWSEDGNSIAYLATEPVPQVSKDRKEYLGDFEVVRKEYSFSHIWTFSLSEAMNGPLIG